MRTVVTVKSPGPAVTMRKSIYVNVQRLPALVVIQPAMNLRRAIPL
jgi:hypothetical protein